jgi:glycine cleavage system H protein
MILSFPKMLSRCVKRTFAKMYTKTHEWVELSGSIGTVGITGYSAAHLGEILWAGVLPGRRANRGDQLGDIESIRDVVTLLAPISGMVVEVNPKLRENPELINAAPETEGWIAKIQMTEPPTTNNLLDAASYKQFLLGERK